MKPFFRDFVEFIREQGVVGLAVGFIFGGAISKLVTSIVNDLINPFVGLILGAAGDLRSAAFHIGSAKIMWGSFLGTLIDFISISAVVYLGFRLLHLERIDKKKK